MSLLKSKGRTSFFKLFGWTGEHQGKRQPKAVRRGHTGRSAHRHAMGSARPRFAVGYVGPLPLVSSVGTILVGTHGRNRRSRMQIPGTTQPNTQQRRAARSSPSARGARPPARAWLRENVRGVGDITSLIGPEMTGGRVRQRVEAPRMAPFIGLALSRPVAAALDCRAQDGASSPPAVAVVVG